MATEGDPLGLSAGGTMLKVGGGVRIGKTPLPDTGRDRGT